MYKFRIVRVEEVNGRFNVHFREVDSATGSLLEEYIQGCESDEPNHITDHILKFFIDRDREMNEASPPHPLVGQEFEVRRKARDK